MSFKRYFNSAGIGSNRSTAHNSASNGTGGCSKTIQHEADLCRTMILIFYALRRELGALRKRIADRSALAEGLRGVRGRIGAEDVVLVATGIGLERGRQTARHALQMLPHPRLVISTGVAGGLVPELKAGDLVIADRLLLESGSGAAFDEVARIAPDSLQLVRAAMRRAGLTPAEGAIVSVNRVLGGAGDKSEAYQRSGAAAADMESAAIAVEVAAASLPFVCVRAVIDEVGDELPGADLPDESGHISPFKAAAFFLKNPAVLTQVPAIMKKMNRATAAIAAAIEALCAHA
jgi:adenosylhomocysteine nucleosidase